MLPTRTMGFWLLLVCAILLPARPRLFGFSSSPRRTDAATSGQKKEVFPEQRWWEAINRLGAMVIHAHVQKSLFAALHLKLTKTVRYEYRNKIDFSRQRFPITLTARDEWPPVLGGCRCLMIKSNFDAAIRALEPLARAPVKNIPVLQRVIIQNALWDVFDSVYREGADPWLAGGQFHRRRWQALLFWLAHDISHIAVQKKNLAAYCAQGLARHRVLGPKAWRKAVELYSFQQLTIHATALGFRRVVRIYLYDPKVNFAKLPAAQMQAFCLGKRKLGAGAVAIETEDAIAVLPGGDGLFPTRIPVIARSYHVVYAGRRNPILDFALYRFSHRTAAFQAKRLKRLPGSFATWALLNLPTIPNGSTGFLARYSVVCAQCHFTGQLQSFRSGLAVPKPRYFRLAQSGTGYVQTRTVQRKRQSLDYAALTYYSSQPLPRMNTRR